MDIAKFSQEFLQHHNQYRNKHGSPPLSLSPQICKYSQEWADHLSSTGKLETHPKPQYGENLFCVMSSDPNYQVSPKEVVDAWYGEMKNHTFGKEPQQITAGNFTQLVWISSKELGVGVAKNSKGQTFVVANYNPPGNVIGKFEFQVPPEGGWPKGSAQEKAAAKGTQASKPQSQEEMKAEGLRVHNNLRAMHGCPPLTMDEKMCSLHAVRRRSGTWPAYCNHHEAISPASHVVSSRISAIISLKRAWVRHPPVISQYQLQRQCISPTCGILTKLQVYCPHQRPCKQLNCFNP